MVEDTPDFGDTEYIQSTAESTAHLDVDLGDLLTQLETLNIHQANIENATLTILGATFVTGVPLRYVSGVPIFIEDFEYDRNIYYGYGSGVDNSSGRVNTFSWSKGYCWRLIAGSDASHNSRVSWTMGGYPKVLMGFQFCFSWNYRMDYFWAEMVLIWSDVRYDPQIQISDDLKRIQILDHDDGWQTVYEWDVIHRDVDEFHFIKVLFDLTIGMWDTLYFNEHEIDISSYKLKVGAGTNTGYIYFRLSNIGQSGYNPEVYIDNICLTDES